MLEAKAEPFGRMALARFVEKPQKYIWEQAKICE
jgi:hypothetical protein